MPELITSRKNEMVRTAARLGQEHAARRESGAFLTEGARLCMDAALSGLSVEILFYTEDAEKKYASYLERTAAVAKAVYQVEPHVAELLSDTKSFQGIFCVCGLPTCTDFSVLNGKHCLGLENLQDPANLGAVLRTAEALGIGGVALCGQCCDPFSPKALRAGMGAVFRLPVISVETVGKAVNTLEKQGYQTLAAIPDATTALVTGMDFSRPTLMMVGNEGAGLSDEAVAACRAKVTIPMAGRAESLNAAASAAILMWEMSRLG